MARRSASSPEPQAERDSEQRAGCFHHALLVVALRPNEFSKTHPSCTVGRVFIQ
jgi:hypothetical protein